MAGQRHGRSTLSRRHAVRRERARILVATEGELTEPEYLHGLAQHLRATGVRLQGPTLRKAGRDPLGVVKAAEKAVELTGPYDHVWCVFDVDSHARLDAAISLAGRLGFRCAISNPSFEIWLLWHHEDHTASIGKRDLKQRLRRHGMPGKAIPQGFPFSSFADAIARCGKPCDGKPPNPGSSMCELAGILSSAGTGR